MSSQSGVINASEMYSLPEFQARVGFGRHAMRAARRAGLPVRRFASRGFILGQEAIEFFKTAPTAAGDETEGGAA